MGGEPVRFDGLVPEEERRDNLQEFRRGRADFLIGNAAAGGRGLPMDVADLAVFYSNYFSGRMREQVEARTEALFKKTPTNVVDIVCEGTIDEKIVAVLRSKKSLSAVIMRDNLGEWL
jgi:SNF2 family DNA or RNA helicase